MPQRIQRKRTKGWRMPEGAVYVGRKSKWGNPFRIGDDVAGMTDEPMDATDVCHQFALFTAPSLPVIELRGKDLACWCALDQPCHADVLIELANK